MFTIEEGTQNNPFVEKICNAVNNTQNYDLIFISKQKSKVNILQTNQHELMLRSFSIDHDYEISIPIQGFQLPKSPILTLYVQQSEAFIVYSNPIKIMYLASNKKPIPLILEQNIQIQNARCNIDYPFVYFYGFKEALKENSLLQLNLDSLSLRKINDGKGYSPNNCLNYISHFQQGRLYIFGGQSKNQQFCQKLLWIFDFEKNYWFALQMQYPEDIGNDKSIESFSLTDSIAIFTSQNSKSMWALQLHQSRFTKLNHIYEYKDLNLIIGQNIVNFDRKNKQCLAWEKRIIKNKGKPKEPLASH